MRAIKGGVPLWELLDKPLTAEQQRAEVQEYQRIYSTLQHDSQIDVQQTKKLFSLCHLAVLQYQTAISLESSHYVALIVCLSAIAVTSKFLLTPSPTVGWRDIACTAAFMLLFSFVLPSLFVIDASTGQAVSAVFAFACVLLRRHPRDELITFAEIAAIAGALVRASTMGQPVLVWAYFLTSLWLFVWTQLKPLQAIRAVELTCAFAAHSLVLYLAASLTAVLLFFLAAATVAGICYSAFRFQRYRLLYPKFWELPSVNSYK